MYTEYQLQEGDSEPHLKNCWRLRTDKLYGSSVRGGSHNIVRFTSKNSSRFSTYWRKIPSSIQQGKRREPFWNSSVSSVPLNKPCLQEKLKTSLVAQTVKCLSTLWETWVRALGWEGPLEKEMSIHSSTIAWKIPWTEEPGRLQSMGLQRVRHDWATSLSLFRRN